MAGAGVENTFEIEKRDGIAVPIFLSFYCLSFKAYFFS